jgi:two-component system, OmpR family, sensor histidine kinase CiaH
MFRKALLKMTLFYLLILMSISLFFSIALYRISTLEVQRSLGRQQKNYEKAGPFMRSLLEDPELLAQSELDVRVAKQAIIWQLIYTNIGIFVLGGGLSYFLAVQTIRPIEESHEAQARFTGDASHELRSPLASMKAEIEVALRDKKLTKEEAVEILKSNLEEVERLSLLSGYLLELSKDDGKNLELSRVDISYIVEKAMDSVAPKAKQKKVAIKSTISEKYFVLGNSSSLTDLLVILLDNAIKYSKSGSEVTINSKKSGRCVELSVCDLGTGIAEKDVPYIFDRFYRADHSRSKLNTEGYGLGLPLAKKIAEANHGDIFVKSRLGEGATFTVKLIQKT